MTDLSAITSHIIPHDIINPATGKKTGLVVYLRPLDHPELKKVMQSQETEGLRIARRGKVPDGEEREESALKIIMTAIDGWEWGLDEDGKQSSFSGEQPSLTPVNVRALIKAFPDFRTQVEDVYEDKRRFFRN